MTGVTAGAIGFAGAAFFIAGFFAAFFFAGFFLAFLAFLAGFFFFAAFFFAVFFFAVFFFAVFFFAVFFFAVFFFADFLFAAGFFAAFFLAAGFLADFFFAAGFLFFVAIVYSFSIVRPIVLRDRRRGKRLLPRHYQAFGFRIEREAWWLCSGAARCFRIALHHLGEAILCEKTRGTPVWVLPRATI
jgi:hypothetical protein